MNIPMRFVGAVNLVDVDIMSRHWGRETRPFPLLRGDFSGFDSPKYEEYARTLPGRFAAGHLSPLRDWFNMALKTRDIRISCIIESGHNKVSIRLLAVRESNKGYIAYTKDGSSKLDVYETDAFDLGSVISRIAFLKSPGIHAEILFEDEGVEDDTALSRDDLDIGDINIHQCATRRAFPRISNEEVLGFGILQSEWQPDIAWAFDYGKPLIKWYNTIDGDYISSKDGNISRPLTRKLLRDRIDRSIAENVAQIKRRRHGETVGYVVT